MYQGKYESMLDAGLVPSKNGSHGYALAGNSSIVLVLDSTSGHKLRAKILVKAGILSSRSS